MKVSVVIAVYNGAWCIERGLESVLAQTRPPDEILVCDDGSTDGTPDLVERRFGDRVQVLRLPHRSAPAARAAGLARAAGAWLAFMDADDTWMPSKLERQLAFITQHPEIRLIASDGRYVSDQAVIRASWMSDYFEPWEGLYGDLYPAMLERCFALFSSIMVERDAYHLVGGMDTGLFYSCDYDIALKIAARFPAAVMAEPLIAYLWSPNQLSRRIEARYRDDLDVMRRAERGAYRSNPAEQRRAAARAAALEYDIGLLCLRSGRIAEGRERMRRAAANGPLMRRLLAAAGSLLPSWAVPVLKRTAALKGVVHGAREVKEKIRLPDEERGAA